MKIILLDNGSLRPESTRNLRRVAAALTEHSGHPVEPVSLLHSRKVPAEELDGVPARVFERSIKEWAAEGERDFAVVPFFFGPSQAFTDYLPGRIAALQAQWPDLDVAIGRPLVDLEDGGDLRIAQILVEQTEDALACLHGVAPERIRHGGIPPTSVALVDHGSPIPEVAAVRNFVAGQVSVLLQQRLGDAVARVVPCSMERREGDAYRFNEPLLEHLLDDPAFASGPVVVAMQFLSPGRHAGEAGDVATICADAEARNPGLRTVRTALVGVHPDIVDVVADRLQELLDLPHCDPVALP